MAGSERSDGVSSGMNHLPICATSFSGGEARFVQPSAVDAEELDGYEVWRDAEGGYFLRRRLHASSNAADNSCGAT